MSFFLLKLLYFEIQKILFLPNRKVNRIGIIIKILVNKVIILIMLFIALARKADFSNFTHIKDSLPKFFKWHNNIFNAFIGFNRGFLSGSVFIQIRIWKLGWIFSRIRWRQISAFCGLCLALIYFVYKQAARLIHVVRWVILQIRVIVY